MIADQDKLGTLGLGLPDKARELAH